MISIHFQHDIHGAGERIAAVAAQVQRPEALLKVVGRRGANELKRHFRKRDQTPNRLGGKRTHHWRRTADSVQNPVLESSTVVAIAISDPAYAIKLFGGTITPKTKGALTIPTDPLSYGRTVKTFEQETGIELFRLKRTGGVLTNLLMGAMGDGDVKVFYVLSAGVTQEPDPEALPPKTDFEAALVNEADKFLAREIATAERRRQQQAP